jgi:NADPH:quinone reductase-like Zn-dependent oxidoreductase
MACNGGEVKALYYEQFGSPDVLRYGELQEPQLGPDSVMVKVAATSVNPVDWKLMSGGLSSRMTSVFPVVPGWDLAGTVTEVGPSVTQVKVGDEVWGYVRMDYVHCGTFAQFVSVPERVLALRPPTVSVAHAAAVPLAGLTAYQALIHRLQLSSQDRLLLLGGAGGVGGFAIQIARSLGATVYATGSERNHEYLESLGARPLSHLESSWKELRGAGISAVFDLYGGESLGLAITALGGAERVVTVADPSIVGRGGHYVFVKPSPQDLDSLGDLIVKGKVRVEIQQRFSLHEAKRAVEVSRDGHVRGKLVVEVEQA